MPDRYESKVKKLVEQGMSYQEAQQSKCAQVEEPKEDSKPQLGPELVRDKTDKKGK